MQAICFGFTAIRSRKRSTKLIAENKTSDGSSYHIFKQRKTYAEPSLPPAVTSRCFNQKLVSNASIILLETTTLDSFGNNNTV